MEVAQALEYLHNRDVVHKNVKIVRAFLHLPTHALTLPQANVLVDARGNAHLGGLGVALLPSDTPVVNVDKFFYGAAPELVEPERFRLIGTGATKASDVYAFGVLAWEVSTDIIVSPTTHRTGLTARHSLGKSRSPTSSMSREPSPCGKDIARLDLITPKLQVVCGR